MTDFVEVPNQDDAIDRQVFDCTGSLFFRLSDLRLVNYWGANRPAGCVYGIAGQIYLKDIPEPVMLSETGFAALKGLLRNA